ncbi:MAG: hypothetical protein JWP96_2865 [Polaromonas sp.]|nr:hypothetical protein [Polaromonas sp.]
MNIHAYSNLPAALAFLAASFCTTRLGAQTSPSVPAPPAYRSALEGYQPYTEEKTVNWKEANDTTRRIGGWREYAKEASQAQTPPSSAKPDSDATPAKPGQENP